MTQNKSIIEKYKVDQYSTGTANTIIEDVKDDVEVIYDELNDITDNVKDLYKRITNTEDILYYLLIENEDLLNSIYDKVLNNLGQNILLKEILNDIPMEKDVTITNETYEKKLRQDLVALAQEENVTVNNVINIANKIKKLEIKYGKKIYKYR